MKRIIYPISRIVVFSTVLFSLLSSCLFSVVMAQQITVNPDAYNQEFVGTGASCGLYLAHYLNMSREDQLKASQMLYQDLKLKYIKNYQDDYPWADPSGYDKVVTAINNAKIYQPNLKVIICANNLPDHLEVEKAEHDSSIPGILDSVANYYFHICKGYYDRGVKVDILELVNERSYDNKVTDLYDKAAKKFKAMINNPNINTTHVPMPYIAGPATWSAAATEKFITGWKSERPNAWQNIDIVTTHGYEYGAEKYYTNTFNVAEGKPFYLSEQTGKIQTGEEKGVDVIAEQFPNESAPDYVYNAEIARHMIDFFNGGGNAFFHFLANNPKGSAAALLGIQYGGSPEASIVYYGFKHMSATHPSGSKRVGRSLTNMGNYKAIAFRVPGENVVYVHFVNLYNTNGQVKVDFKSYDIKAVQAWETDENSNFEAIMNKTFSTAQKDITINVGPYSVHTLKVTIAPESSKSNDIVANHIYSIKAEHSGKYLEVANASSEKGANVQQWEYKGTDNQKWLAKDLGNNVYMLKAQNSSKCLKVGSDGNVIQWPCNSDQINQQWKITDNGDGSFKVESQVDGKVLHVEGAGLSNGANVKTSSWANKSNQKWDFDDLGVDNARVTGLEDSQLSSVKIYPIPASDKVTIDSGMDKLTKFTIYDMFGRKINHGEFVGKVSIDAQCFSSSGIYNVVLSNSNVTVTKRIMVKK